MNPVGSRYRRLLLVLALILAGAIIAENIWWIWLYRRTFQEKFQADLEISRLAGRVIKTVDFSRRHELLEPWYRFSKSGSPAQGRAEMARRYSRLDREKGIWQKLILADPDGGYWTYRELEKLAGDYPENRYRMILLEGIFSLLVLVFLISLLVRFSLRLDRLWRDRKIVLKSLSHSLFTPLAGWRLGLDNLLHPGLGDQRRSQIVSRLKNQTKQLEQKIRQALLLQDALPGGGGSRRDDVTDMSGGGGKPIGQLLAGCLEETREQAEQFAARIETHFDPVDTAHRIPRGPADYLKIIFENILTNALKYGGQPPEIIIRVEEKKRGLWSRSPGRGFRPALLVSFTDNGNGIPGRERRRVWQMHYRLDNHSTDSGMGLGLYLVRYLAGRSRVRTRILPRPDGQPGTRFELEIPVWKNEKAETSA